jgi:quinol monooxygenase YgiN
MRARVAGVRARRKEGRQMFEVTARLKVRDGELEGFKRQAAEMMRLTKELDSRTLRYDWFLSEDGRECEVREAYVDADGLLKHAMHVGDARDKLFRDFAAGHDMTFYAEPSPALAEAMKAIPPGAVTVHRYAFFQGLESERLVPDEIAS